ncbi:uncharacterized protein [Watersipora subatra]|uniref:uncharacterized protein n=1 Tax=Watersipora subatra TaxID=2589382 RepID=UPI00355B0D0C
MVSRRVVSGGVAVAAIYFAVFGVHTGFLLIASLTSFLIGGRIGFTSRVITRVQLMVCVLILILSKSGYAKECSRTESRHARQIINRLIIPRFSLAHIEIPASCPLSPANDQYAAHEGMKRRLGDSWMCSVCGKNYELERDLEFHLSDNHRVEKANGCLADYCDMLRCEPLFGIHRDHVECVDSEMLGLRHKCMDMVRDKCLPHHLSSEAKLKLEVAVQASLCSYLTCDDYWTTPEEDSSGSHYYYTTYAAAVCVLVLFLFIYFKIASSNIDNSVSIEHILAEADKYERPKPAIIPPDTDMEIRHRGTAPDRQWSENE